MQRKFYLINITDILLEESNYKIIFQLKRDKYYAPEENCKNYVIHMTICNFFQINSYLH